MNELLKTSSTRRFILFILIFLVSTDLAIILDIPYLRQVLGFVFLTIIPGLLILYILRLNKLELTEKIVLSVGLSISFLMFFGLFINSVYLLFGYNTPLSTNSLIISFSVITLILAIIAYLRNRRTFFINLSDLKLNAREKVFLLVPACFPLLSIVGMYLMNTTDNNVMLMALLFSIPAYAIFIAVKHAQVPERVYPLMIFLTSISLVLLLALRSNHIIGSDAHAEYSIFLQTFHNEQWQILGSGILDSLLSISLLPAIYQSFININSEYLFKILYPILLSVLPLVVYLISKKYIGSSYAFLATLFFMSQQVFLSAAYNPRTSVAILFFALSVIVLIMSRLDELSKISLYMIFGGSIIVSHYSTAFIAFFVLLLTYIGMQVIPKMILRQRKPVPSRNPSPGKDPPSSTSSVTTLEATRSHVRTHVTFTSVALFFVILFFWYSQVTGPPFHSAVIFISETFKGLPEFFILESRGEAVTALAGVELTTKGIPHQVEFAFTWITIAFIGIGVLTALGRARHMVDSPSKEKETPPFLNQKIDVEFFVYALACSVILVVALVLPRVFVGYSMLRTYCQMMTVLSPFFVIGGIMIAKFLHTKWTYLVVLLAIIPYFMCTTSTMYQMFGVPRAITLNSEGRSYDILFMHDQESSAARWLGDHTAENARIYTDQYGIMRLRTQGGIRSPIYAKVLIEDNRSVEGYIFLGHYNVVEGKLVDKLHQLHDMANYHDEFAGKAKIYSNGGSEVWR